MAILYCILALLVVAALIGLYLRRKRLAKRIEAPWPIPEPRQHAIVLAHGLLGFDHLALCGTKHHYFRGISEHLSSHGAVVRTSVVHPLGTVPERAQELARYIEDIDERRVVLVAHSMGGLDARYALSKLGIATQVSALITIATPHRGSCLADAATSLPARALRSMLGSVGLDTDALNWLGELPAEAFNADVKDATDVFYGCVIGQTTRTRVLANPMLLACFELLSRMRGENDGMVPAFSQRWGKEIQLVPAHHFGQIGWSPLFDANHMYLQLLSDLHRAGFHCLPDVLPGQAGAVELLSDSKETRVPSNTPT